MKAPIGRLAVPLLVGFAPVAMMLLTWVEPGTKLGPGDWLLKSLALPILAAELLVIGLTAQARLRCGPASAAPPPFVVVGLAALLTLAMLTAATAPDPMIAFLRTSFWVVHLLFAWSVMAFCRRFPEGRKHITDAVMAGFAIAAALLLLFVLRIEDPTDFDWMNGLPGFDNIRRIAYFAAPVLGLCLGRFALPASRADRLWTLAVASLAGALILWNGARGAIVALAVAFAIGAALLPELRRVHVVSAVGASAVLGGVIASAMPCSPLFMGMSRLFKARIGGDGVDPTTGVTSGRSDLWQGAIQAILERPLFGYGEGQTWFVVPAARTFEVMHPHNLLLQTLLAWGAAGTLLLLALAVPFARRTLRTVRAEGGELLPPFLAMLVLLIYSGVDGTLFHVQAAGLFAAFAGAVTLPMASRSGRRQPPLLHLARKWRPRQDSNL